MATDAGTSDRVEYENRLTATGGDDHALCRAIGGLLTALVESGCALTSYEYSGDGDSGFVEFTAEGTAEQVRLMKATINGWADN